MEDVSSSPQQLLISGVVNSRLIRPPGSIEGYEPVDFLYDLNFIFIRLYVELQGGSDDTELH